MYVYDGIEGSIVRHSIRRRVQYVRRIFVLRVCTANVEARVTSSRATREAERGRSVLKVLSAHYRYRKSRNHLGTAFFGQGSLLALR